MTDRYVIVLHQRPPPKLINWKWLVVIGTYGLTPYEWKKYIKMSFGHCCQQNTTENSFSPTKWKWSLTCHLGAISTSVARGNLRATVFFNEGELTRWCGNFFQVSLVQLIFVVLGKDTNDFIGRTIRRLELPPSRHAHTNKNEKRRTPGGNISSPLDGKTLNHSWLDISMKQKKNKNCTPSIHIFSSTIQDSERGGEEKLANLVHIIHTFDIHFWISFDELMWSHAIVQW